MQHGSDTLGKRVWKTAQRLHVAVSLLYPTARCWVVGFPFGCRLFFFSPERRHRMASEASGLSQSASHESSSGAALIARQDRIPIWSLPTCSSASLALAFSSHSSTSLTLTSRLSRPASRCCLAVLPRRLQRVGSHSLRLDHRELSDTCACNGLRAGRWDRAHRRGSWHSRDRPTHSHAGSRLHLFSV